MSISEVDALLARYWDWLRERTALRAVDGWVEITTPYLDRHNDHLQVYASKQNGGYLLTDDGHTITDLEQSGCKLDTPKRQGLLQMTLAGFGVAVHEGRLEVTTSPESFAARKHNLVQAMLAVNDLFYLAQPHVESLFYEDVVDWLDLNEIRYTPRVNFAGKTGYEHHFNFVIPKSRTQPERILQAINRPSKDTAQALVLAWVDTSGARGPDSRAYALLNDVDREPAADVVEALRAYDVRPVAWSRRDDVREELAA
jgi:hypothetical protein